MKASVSRAIEAPTLDTLLAVIYREAHYLDTRAFDDWLALYAAHACFWMPAWIAEDQLATDPDTELSLIYCAARAGLEDRVWRVRSGLSVASSPLLRTVHAISNPVLISATATQAEVHSSWSCHTWSTKRQEQHTFFGRYEHRLEAIEDRWLITRKKIFLVNDRIPTMLDFYCV